MSDVDEGRFLDLVYGAAASPDLWTSAMEMFADMLGGDAVFLARIDPATGAGAFVRTRYDPAYEAAYNAHFADLNPFVAMPHPDAARGPARRQVFTDEAWLPRADLLRTEFYNDFMRPKQCYASMTVYLAGDKGQLCSLNVGRSEALGAFGAREVAVAEHLRPHISRAFRLADKLADVGVVSGQMDAAMDLSPHGVFVLAQSGRVLRTNRRADRMLAQRAGVSLRQGLLSAIEPAAARDLNALIAVAASSDPEVRRGGGMILKAGPGRPAMSATVAPSRSEPLSVFNHGPTVIVCISDLTARAEISGPELQALLGVTAAEARVALAIMAGGTARAVAANLDLSFHTVRHHLQSLLDKTGAQDKAELVALLTRAAASLSR